MKTFARLRADPVIVVVIIAIAVWAVVFSRDKSPAETKVSTEIVAVSETKTVAEKGNLVFEDTFYDFGQVTEADVIHHTFKFRNAGSAPMRILKTETTCGCTTMSSIEKEYAPGEEGEMKVTIDTRGKKGIVVKTVKIHLQNNKTETMEVSLSMTLVPQPHPKKDGTANINTDSKCKTCHLEDGQGQQGVFLYHRVCVQCHGKKGAGATARALNDAQWQKHVDDAYIRQRINEGLVEMGMPSFVKGVEPALDDDQVNSLIKYIRELGAAAVQEAGNNVQ